MRSPAQRRASHLWVVHTVGIAVCTLAMDGLSTTGQPPPVARQLTQIGKRYDIQVDLAMQPDAARLRLVPHQDPQELVRYMRVQIRLVRGARGRWYLTVRDADLRPVEVLTPESFAASTVRWTGRIPGSVVSFDLDPADDSTETRETKLSLDEYIGMPEKAAISYYSIQVDGHPRYRELYKDPDRRKRRLGDAVGFLMGSYVPKSWCCSGVVVGENLLLTNWHCGGVSGSTPPECFWSRTVCRDTLIDLSWDGDGLSREFQCLEVLAKDRERDFALLRVGPLGAGTAADPLRLRGAPPAAGEALAIIHHPECKSKQITDSCTVVEAAYPAWVGGRADIDFTHQCDTEEGSSGGAVLDGQGRLIGLHHMGFAQTDDVAAKAQRRNAAVRMDQIRAFLESCTVESDACRPGLDALLQVRPR